MKESHVRRFWASVEFTDQCWIWRGSRTAGGYGRFSFGCDRAMAHRIAYERLVGPIPQTMVLDHLCRNRACVNPEHLEAVTNTVNIMRGVGPAALNARKTICKWGHRLEGSNLRERSDGYRECVECSQAFQRASKAQARYRRRYPKFRWMVRRAGPDAVLPFHKPGTIYEVDDPDARCSVVIVTAEDWATRIAPLLEGAA